MNRPLKLRARSAADLALISSLLQDALIRGVDITLDSRTKRFVAVFNRFCWEREKDKGKTTKAGETPYYRTHAGLVIDHVRKVQSKGVHLKDSTKLLNLLSIHDLGHQIELVFSGNAAIRVKCTGLLVHMNDLGNSWPTKWRPQHDSDEKILEEEANRSLSESIGT